MSDRVKIRAEVQRLRRELGEQRDVNLDELIAYIDSMPEETASEDLVEELDNFLKDPVFGKLINRYAGIALARHFTEWGRNHFEDKSEMVSEDLEKEIKRYINEEVTVTSENVVVSKHHEFRNFYVENLVDAARHFAEWQKQRMMKDAVEAIVSQVPCLNEIIFRNPASVQWGYLPSEMNKLGVEKGDKVKIIIVKENTL